MTRTIAISTAASLLAAGCQPSVVSDFCLLARPITYSAQQDAPETKAQIREHNAVFDKLCK